MTGDGLTLDEYQRSAASTDVERDCDDPIVPLLGLAGEVGSLIAEFKKKRRRDGFTYTGFEDIVVTELGDILWYLAALARRVGIPLSVVAEKNLEKTHARWLPSEGPSPLSFDAGFPAEQRLPRLLEVSFETVEGQVVMRMAGEKLGDPIDDNARVADGYRFPRCLPPRLSRRSRLVAHPSLAISTEAQGRSGNRSC